MERIFPFEQLAGEISRNLSACDGRPQTIAKTVDEVVRTCRRNLWDQHPQHRQDMKYYFQALQEYFKENFPIRTKREGARKRQKRLENETDRSRLLEPEHVKSAVRRRLIHRSTQTHILYGKLYEYCCACDDPLPVNGDTLQTIQVLEAVKKQAMTAVLWSVSRLQYFYHYYNGDILSDREEMKKYRENHLASCSCSEQNFRACREKLQMFFPLEDTADRECCTALLEACAACIGKLRVHIFHYKNLDFTKVLEQTAELTDGNSLRMMRQLFNRDLARIQDAFMLRISSMNLPLYYPRGSAGRN